MPIFIDTSGKEFYIDGANEGAQIPVFTEYFGGAQQSFWGVTGTYTALPSGSATWTPVTDIPSAGQKLVVTDIIISTPGAPTTQFKFREETSTYSLFNIMCPANSAIPFTLKSKYKLPTSGKRIEVSANNTLCTVLIGYYYEP